MNTSHFPQELHDKATCGLPLSAEERAQLNKWYAQHDQEEHAMLSRHDSERSTKELRGMVDAAMAGLLTATQRIQIVTAENDDLRREIAVLKQRVAQTTQPA